MGKICDHRITRKYLVIYGHLVLSFKGKNEVFFFNLEREELTDIWKENMNMDILIFVSIMFHCHCVINYLVRRRRRRRWY